MWELITGIVSKKTISACASMVWKWLCKCIPGRRQAPQLPPPSSLDGWETCERTSEHIRTLHACLNVLPRGLMPGVAGMSATTAHKLTQAFGDGSGHGAVLTLHQYMQLIKEMVKCTDICEITYIATESPSDWGTRKELRRLKAMATLSPEDRERLDLLDVVWGTYFSAQKALKERRRDEIRMRRVFVFKGDRPRIAEEDFNGSDEDKKLESLGCPSDQVESLKYLIEQHRSANIGLLMVDGEDLAEDLLDGLVLVLCEDGNKWAIRADYAPLKTTVRTWVVHKSTSTETAVRLFEMIDGIVNSGQEDPRMLVRGTHNEPHKKYWMEKSELSESQGEELTS